ncbi:hypothetical protein Mp_4g20230 [Marchantia polymorpha subsp. ruderalis]|uniref:Uncharacterized protein n=2 Tax=Marchantia polymorpha TaxID=3197 RepID=A0AAF6BBW6_MARPO|nr:hypothetical protein MARPO_0116s0025 [Marchantia polymorpha]BBN09500.1 hypothetical protein Mp_4g20230 [Marchantia polymorpha subsp. ruderalis]|eukprot:PTQ31036.1 hypothetical protein MARPO_0116s0025 [Marchantia polymorpha]
MPSSSSQSGSLAERKRASLHVRGDPRGPAARRVRRMVSRGILTGRPLLHRDPMHVFLLLVSTFEVDDRESSLGSLLPSSERSYSRHLLPIPLE